MKIEIIGDNTGKIRDLSDSALTNMTIAESADFLKYGPDNGRAYSFISLASRLADRLDKRGEILELIDRRDPQEIKLAEETSFYSQVRLGSGLKKGVLAYRGRVHLIEDLEGGSVYVDGDVENIAQCNTGVVYVDGNVGKLGGVDKVAVVVTGRVGLYKEDIGPNAVVDIPSPFIFTSRPFEMVRDSYRSRERSQLVALGLKVPNIFPAEYLTGWLPEQTKSRAMNLCHISIQEYFLRLVSQAKELNDPVDIARFAEHYLTASFESYKDGYYAGAVNSAIDLD